MQERETLLAYSIKYQGNQDAITQAILRHEPIRHVICHESYLTRLDPDFPPELLNLKNPPWVLFYRGDLRILHKPKLSVVGSRKASGYSIRMTRELVRETSKRYVIVSGLAKGIDAVAHETAMETGKTIAVLGCGIDGTYPKENLDLYQRVQAKGLILSEYPPGIAPIKHHFPFRNRIIAALGSFLVVTHGGMKSGTMITVNHALALGKEVICLPQPLDDESARGCNELISQGAQILTCIEDFAKL